MCDEDRKKACASTCGPGLEAACAQCEDRETYEPTAWFQHIARIIDLQESGYPFSKDDLSMEEWLGITEFKRSRDRTQAETMKEQIRR